MYRKIQSLAKKNRKSTAYDTQHWLKKPAMANNEAPETGREGGREIPHVPPLSYQSHKTYKALQLCRHLNHSDKLRIENIQKLRIYRLFSFSIAMKLKTENCTHLYMIQYIHE